MPCHVCLDRSPMKGLKRARNWDYAWPKLAPATRCGPESRQTGNHGSWGRTLPARRQSIRILRTPYIALGDGLFFRLGEVGCLLNRLQRSWSLKYDTMSTASMQRCDQKLPKITSMTGLSGRPAGDKGLWE